MNPFIKLLTEKASSESIALVEGKHNYSYKDLLSYSRRLASLLQAKGLKSGDTAVVACAPGFEFLSIIFATMMLKAKVAIIDPHMGRALYRKKLKQLKPKFAFIDSRLLLLQEHPILRWVYKTFSKNGIYLPHSNAYTTIATGRKLPLVAGLKVNIWSEKWSSKQKIEYIEENDIHVLFGPPADYMNLINYCEKTRRKLPSCLQHLLIGSAPAHVAFLRKLDDKIDASTQMTCTYGMTEHLLAASCDGREKIAYTCEGDLLGTLVSSVKISISESGEILIHSDQLFKKYLGKKAQEGFHSTGDLGILDNQGQLILTGRKKDMIIRKNFNIYPGLYEPTIKKIKGVNEAVLIGIYDESISDERVTLVLEANDSLKKRQIESALRDGEFRINPDALPDNILFRTIPRKGRQDKIDRETLRKQIKKVA